MKRKPFSTLLPAVPGLGSLKLQKPKALWCPQCPLHVGTCWPVMMWQCRLQGSRPGLPFRRMCRGWQPYAFSLQHRYSSGTHGLTLSGLAHILHWKPKKEMHFLPYLVHMYLWYFGDWSSPWHSVVRVPLKSELFMAPKDKNPRIRNSFHFLASRSYFSLFWIKSAVLWRPFKVCSNVFQMHSPPNLVI